MLTGRHSKGRAAKDPGLSRRRFLRAAGVGTAGASVAAGAVAGPAGAEVAGAAVAGAAALIIPARRKVVRA
ncbi:MAG TPA: twin-arginine translocation signal domain-containing protein, partial [Actinomycetes bacterium]|nr:twin-arginine translocation signal domain-containing protein [Actinomycetes bacterium]